MTTCAACRHFHAEPVRPGVRSASYNCAKYRLTVSADYTCARGFEPKAPAKGDTQLAMGGAE